MPELHDGWELLKTEGFEEPCSVTGAQAKLQAAQTLQEAGGKSGKQEQPKLGGGGGTKAAPPSLIDNAARRHQRRHHGPAYALTGRHAARPLCGADVPIAKEATDNVADDDGKEKERWVPELSQLAAQITGAVGAAKQLCSQRVPSAQYVAAAYVALIVVATILCTGVAMSKSDCDAPAASAALQEKSQEISLLKIQLAAATSRANSAHSLAEQRSVELQELRKENAQQSIVLDVCYETTLRPDLVADWKTLALACVADKDLDTDWKTEAAAESCDDDTKMVLVSCRDTNVDCWGDCFECLDEYDFAHCEIECACGDNKLFETELIDWQWSHHGADIGLSNQADMDAILTDHQPTEPQHKPTEPTGADPLRYEFRMGPTFGIFEEDSVAEEPTSSEETAGTDDRSKSSYLLADLGRVGLPAFARECFDTCENDAIGCASNCRTDPVTNQWAEWSIRMACEDGCSARKLGCDDRCDRWLQWAPKAAEYKPTHPLYDGDEEGPTPGRGLSSDVGAWRSTWRSVEGIDD